MRFLRGALTESDGVTDDEPALELALARAMLTEARGGEVEESLRIYRPAAPVAVFGRRDTRLPGFPDAVEAARAAGFEPVVRATGGRAVAYTGAALVVDHVRHEAGAIGGQDDRFAAFGQRFVDLFRGMGVDARLGAVPGEYCPGAHSVNARGTEKLVGTAQRMVPGAWLFSSLVVVGDEDRLRPVLAEIYRCLGQEFDEGSVGSLSREVPGLDVDTVEAAVVDAYRAEALATPRARRRQPARDGTQRGGPASRRLGEAVVKAVVYHRYGGPDVLHVEDVPVPTPGPGQVRVRVAATSVNLSDWECLRGSPAYARMGGLRLPARPTLGSDIAGVVDEVGDGVTGFRAGDEVYGDNLALKGGFAEYALVPESALARKPAGLTFAQASTIPQAGAIALQGTRTVVPGSRVLVNGAGGGSGSLRDPARHAARART